MHQMATVATYNRSLRRPHAQPTSTSPTTPPLARSFPRGHFIWGAHMLIHCLRRRKPMSDRKGSTTRVAVFRSGHVVLRAGRNPSRLRLRRRERGPVRGAANRSTLAVFIVQRELAFAEPQCATDVPT